MKKYLLTIAIFIGLYSTAIARHITGGELYYTYIGPGTAPNSYKYQITLKLYRDCNSTGAQLDDAAAISIYQWNSSSNPTLYSTFSVQKGRIDVLNLTSPGKCIDNPPIVCYQVGIYTFNVELPATPYGYTISYQRCCRIENISNISGSDQIGATYTANIPGTSVLSTAPQNNSAHFLGKDTVIICEGNPFVYDFGAMDPDHDSLTYNLCGAYLGAGTLDPQPISAEPPPYLFVPYSFGFSASFPMGANVTLDHFNGKLSGIAPAAGIYIVTVCVSEFRNGVLINVHRKDLQIKVAECSVAAASLQPEYISCDGFTLTFQNRSNSPLITTYFWDFGVTTQTNDTSVLQRPTFTFPDTGVYKVMLITNRGLDCSDTAYTLAKVFPGFFPGFVVSEGCKNVALQFTDTTKTKYGIVDTWGWDFGVINQAYDTSHLQNPQFTYTDTGTFNVRFIVTNSKGCRDTVAENLTVRARPLLFPPNDTLICDIDTAVLSAKGPPGTYTWSPNYAINTLNGPDILVSPDVTTTYTVSLTTVPGCTSTDTVRVNVVSFVTLSAGPDTTICLTDTLMLNPFSDGLKFVWVPAGTLNDPNIKNPLATPLGPTLYSVTAYIGKCFASDNVAINTVPYPLVRASNDSAICYGDRIQLFATGGAFYRWAPPYAISSTTIPNPIVGPLVSTNYVVTVTDTLGCPKPTNEPVFVRVIPPVPANAGSDTAAVLNQPLQLFATGAEFYEWSPPTWLNNPNIQDPIATFVSDPGDSITYVVKVSTIEGCFAYDTMTVRIFKTAPDIFVPTAFTPNRDGKNDIFRAIPVGIREFDYFSVYNRWGQLVFTTTNPRIGWDGTVGGKEQSTDTFVWRVRGVDYLGKVVQKKGTVTLIR